MMVITHRVWIIVPIFFFSASGDLSFVVALDGKSSGKHAEEDDHEIRDEVFGDDLDIEVESPFVPKRAKIVQHADDAADEFLDGDLAIPESGVFQIDAKAECYSKLFI